MRKRASPILAIIIFLLMPLTAHAEIIVPQELIDVAEEIAPMYGVCPELIESIVIEECSCKYTATNGNCIGAMQINQACHKKRMARLGVTDLKDLRSNVMVGTDYLAEILESHEDIGTALLIYNGCSTAKISKYEDTGSMTVYAKRILERSEQLERQHNK